MRQHPPKLLALALSAVIVVARRVHPDTICWRRQHSDHGTQHGLDGGHGFQFVGFPGGRQT
jgi:hypothetical protein